MGESQGAGAGAGGFAAAAGAAGFTAAGGPGAAAATFGAFAGVAAEGFSGGVFVSDCTDPEGVAFTPPGMAGWSALGAAEGGGEGDLGSSGMLRTGQNSGAFSVAKNDNFYQLEGMVSTTSPARNVILSEVFPSLGEGDTQSKNL